MARTAPCRPATRSRRSPASPRSPDPSRSAPARNAADGRDGTGTRQHCNPSDNTLMVFLTKVKEAEAEPESIDIEPMTFKHPTEDNFDCVRCRIAHNSY